MVTQKVPGFLSVARIERHAQEIRDPIERLKYLRQATTPTVSLEIRRRSRPMASFALLALVVPLASDANVRRSLEARPRALPPRVAGQGIPNVWLVEQARDYEVYSNGLRVENRLTVSNKPRAYSLIRRDGATTYGARRAQPAGIVFHTTESHQAPFEADQTHAIQRIGQELLLFVRAKRAYHFVIDRFGRVHRMVAESDEANHAGNSVWADGQWLYLDLNASFLGVAFEATMQTGQPPNAVFRINDAQIHAGKVLTEMLRSKYNLPAENCVTHAQISVNPENRHIGWHADWGKGFPFREMGLPANYEQPLPSLYLFGFEYDPVYQAATGPDLWKGLDRADELVREAAAARCMAVADYRKLLQRDYRDQIAALRDRGAGEEN